MYDPEQPKPVQNYLRGLQSLPDNKWVHRRPKVTERPHLYVVGGDEGVEDTKIFLPKLPEPPDDICA